MPMPLEMLMAALGGPQAPASDPPFALPTDPLPGKMAERENILASLSGLAEVEDMPVPPAPGKAQFVFAAIQDALNAAAAVQERMPSLQTRSVQGLVERRGESQAVERQNVQRRNEAKRQAGLVGAQAKLGAVEGDIGAIRAQQAGNVANMRRTIERREERTFETEDRDLQWKRTVEENEKNRKASMAELEKRLGADKAHEQAKASDAARAQGSFFLKAFVFGDQKEGIPTVAEVASGGPAAMRTMLKRLRLELETIPDLSQDDLEMMLERYRLELEEEMDSQEIAAETEAGQRAARERVIEGRRGEILEPSASGYRPQPSRR